MLKQRIVTAIVLLAILLPALFWKTPEPFLAIVLLLIAAGGWEWGRLNGLRQGACIALGIVTLALCVGAWMLGWPQRPSAAFWSVAGAVWVLAGAALVWAGVDGWPRIAQPVRVVGGVLALALAWLAMAQARVIGVNFLLSILVLVWVADVFAYFAGRAIGGKFTRRKLAPTISPNKSWEGVWGGMLAVALYALALTAIGSRVGYTGEWKLSLALAFVAFVVVLAAISIVGDLYESMLKRQAGVKDSGTLLPGHGGVLDRIDALLPAMPLAAIAATLLLPDA